MKGGRSRKEGRKGKEMKGRKVRKEGKEGRKEGKYLLFGVSQSQTVVVRFREISRYFHLVSFATNECLV
jgi:hypothetical protein